MSKIEAKVLCGKCLVEVQGPDEPSDDSIFTCPECGRSDTHAAIVEEVGNYYRDMVAKKLDDQMKDITRRSKFISVEGFNPPDREYRFILSELP